MLRLAGKILGAFIVLIMLTIGVLYALSYRKLNRTIPVTDTVPTVERDSATVARGAYLVQAITKCGECHGESLGGGLMIDGGPFATVYAPNLTSGRGGVLAQYSDEEVARAVRHGVRRNGRPLLIMPAANFNPLSDADMGAIIAYLRSIPPMDNTLEESRLGPIGHFLYATNRIPTLVEADLLDHDAKRADAPPPGLTPEYGRYVATIGGCNGCHGPGLSGGTLPGAPPDMKPASNLTPTGIGTWSEADFIRALREGRRPDGSPIDSTAMPIRSTRLMTDEDIRAVWTYLKTVPPKPFGNR